MRVLHVVASFQRRGAEIFAADLVAALNADGVAQNVAVLESGGEEAVSFAAPVAVLDDRRAGARLGAASMINVDGATAGRLRDVVVRLKPDLIQAHGGRALKYSILATVRHRTPTIYRRIGAAPSGMKRGPKRLVHGALMRRSDRVVAVADALQREVIERFGISPERVVVIPNGIDPARIRRSSSRSSIRRSLGIAAGDVVLLSLGAITWEKDPMTHLGVAQRVLAARPGVRHLVVGDGPMLQRMRREVAIRGLGGRVTFLGSRRDVGDVLAASDVLLFASRPDGMEGMPAQVIESGMSGVPVAGYAIAGVPEVVRDGDTGVLVPSGDVEALSRAVIGLVDDDDRRRSMGVNARERCRDFDIAVVARRYRSLYDGVLGNTPALVGARAR